MFQQRRFRCPESPDQVHEIEQIVAPFCPVGNARTQRNPIDRAWDVLRRLYFVAFSRPQNALLLVGLHPRSGQILAFDPWQPAILDKGSEGLRLFQQHSGTLHCHLTVWHSSSGDTYAIEHSEFAV